MFSVVVSVVAFYHDAPSSNPAEVYNYLKRMKKAWTSP